MTKYYNVYEDLGDLYIKDELPFTDLRKALSSASEDCSSYRHTFIINDDLSVEIVDYQDKVEEMFAESEAEEDLEQQHHRQLNSDYYSSRGC